MSNTPRTKEKIFPFSWEEWELFDTLTFHYINVVFYEYFGEFIAFEIYDSVLVDYENGIIKGYINGEEVAVTSFKATVINK